VKSPTSPRKGSRPTRKAPLVAEVARSSAVPPNSCELLFFFFFFFFRYRQFGRHTFPLPPDSGEFLYRAVRSSDFLCPRNSGEFLLPGSVGLQTSAGPRTLADVPLTVLEGPVSRPAGSRRVWRRISALTSRGGPSRLKSATQRNRPARHRTTKLVPDVPSPPSASRIEIFVGDMLATACPRKPSPVNSARGDRIALDHPTAK